MHHLFCTRDGSWFYYAALPSARIRVSPVQCRRGWETGCQDEECGSRFVSLLNSCHTYDPANTANISRSRPYERPSKSNNQEVLRTSQDGPSRKQVDGATLSRLFQRLAPLTKDPLNFESAATAICTSFDLDPATSAEIVTSFKQQLPADKSQGSKCVWFFLPCLIADVKL